MLILERTTRWYEWGGGYLEFSSAVAWLMCAVLAAMFLVARDPSPGAGRRVATWGSLAAAFLLLAGGYLAIVLERNGRGWPITEMHLRATSAFPIAVGAWLFLGLAPVPLPRPHAWWRRAGAVIAGLVPLAHGFLHPATQPWSAATVYGIGGLWLLFREPVGPADGIARVRGGALATLALGAITTLDLPETAVPAAVVAAGACGTGAALWRLYLQERTLPSIRERRGWAGIRPWWVLPATQILVLIAGGLTQRYAVRQTESFAAQRLVDELRAVSAALGDRLLPDHDAASASPQIYESLLRTLLATSPAFRACALTSADAANGSPALFAAKPLRTGDDPAILHPPPGLEPHARLRNETVVQWKSPTRPDDLIVVQLPLLADASATPVWQLTVTVEAQELADIIVSQRLQLLTIVALAALAAGIVVLATVRARNETELHLLKERAELENQARNELLAMVSHEVRTPLQSILGYAELAAMDALPVAAERHIHAIRSQGAALVRIVQDILDLSALRSGRLELQAEAVDLAALAAEVRQALAERARRKGLALSIAIHPGTALIVVVDRVRLLQVLLNLVGNAIKFTVRGGVHLTLSPLPTTLEPTEARVEFRVEDTGPGIPQPHLRRVFEPFRKLSDQSASHSGVGLGLAICEQIVASLNGHISVESHEGRGTTFRVQLTLPVAPASALTHTRAAHDAHAAPPIAAPGTLTGLHVLLIEDHPLVRDLLRDALQRLGAHVVACADGVTGLAAAAHTRPDAVLLDLKLPDRSPAEMLAGLRPDGASPHQPWIVGLSAGATEPEIQQALDRGMNDFLLKPVAIAGLAETLRLSPAGAKITVPVTADSVAPVDFRAATPQERSTLFAETAPAIVRIAHACHVGDSERAAAEAHFLANSCLVLGLDAAQQICRTIEDAAERDDLAAARDALNGLRVEIARAQPTQPPAPD